jgi:hypothetical protein
MAMGYISFGLASGLSYDPNCLHEEAVYQDKVRPSSAIIIAIHLDRLGSLPYALASKMHRDGEYDPQGVSSRDHLHGTAKADRGLAS